MSVRPRQGHRGRRRSIRLVGSILIVFALLVRPVIGQVPSIPPIPDASMNSTGSTGSTTAPTASSGNQVTITNTKKCCSIWDFLGIAQIAQALGALGQLPLFQLAEQTLLGPLAGAVGLNPATVGPLSQAGTAGTPTDPTAPPTPAAVAPQIAAQQKQTKVKVQAIRYLARQDCLCYPEIVDALLASLDDCAEVVRYEALKALRKCCGSGGCIANGTGIDSVTNGCGCPSCQCQIKVILRLSDLLLDKNVNGGLRETSERVRRLSRQMLHECLCRTPIAPPNTPIGTQAEPDPFPDTAPASARTATRPSPNPAAKSTGAAVVR